MKLLQMLLEMPLKQIKKGIINNVTSDKEFSEHTNFRTTDITIIDKKLTDGSYHLALSKLPFDFYVYISDKVERNGKNKNHEGLSWANSIMKKNPKAVVFLLANNNSDGHIPLTPWMIIHRFIQDAMHVNGSYINMFEIYDRHLDSNENGFHKNVSPDYYKNYNTIIASCCEMKSVKSKRGLSIDEEIAVEIPTEIAITGKLRRNINAGIRSEFDSSELKSSNVLRLRRALTTFFDNVEKDYIEYFKTIKGIYITNQFYKSYEDKI